MTRKEAKEAFEENRDLIDILYDDFENRTCRSCKHYDENEDACFSDVVNPCREIRLYEANSKFGCNIGWESK